MYISIPQTNRPAIDTPKSSLWSSGLRTSAFGPVMDSTARYACPAQRLVQDISRGCALRAFPIPRAHAHLLVGIRMHTHTRRKSVEVSTKAGCSASFRSAAAQLPVGTSLSLPSQRQVEYRREETPRENVISIGHAWSLPKCPRSTSVSSPLLSCHGPCVRWRDCRLSSLRVERTFWDSRDLPGLGPAIGWD